MVRWWPWRTREAIPRDYTAQLIESLVWAVSDESRPDVTACSGVQIASSIYASVIAGCEVTTSRPAVANALTPQTLGSLARDFVLYGESVRLIGFEQGRLLLRPCVIVEVEGGPRDPIYRVEEIGPVQTIEHTPRPGELLHVVWDRESSRPWRGSPRWQRSYAIRALAALERSIGHEAAGPVGHALTAPADAQISAATERAQYLDDMLDRVNSAAGDAVRVTTQNQTRTWLNDGTAKPAQNVLDELRRFGPEFSGSTPLVLAELRAASAAVYGIAPPLIEARAPSAARREALREFIEVAAEPVARVLTEVLSEQLDAPDLQLALPQLRSADIASRARAVHSLGAAGVELDEALALAGLS